MTPPGVSRRTAIVTGAAGFLGSHLVDRLLEEGYSVVGLDNLCTGAISNLQHASRDPHFHFHLGDVREPLPARADVIFNLACPASPPRYQADPHATLTTSVLGALRVLEAAQGTGSVIVHASTSEVYGDPVVHPQHESYWGNVNPVGVRACYDEGKRCAETIFADARRGQRVDARIARIFNTYGPRMALDDGRVVSNLITQALLKRPLTIYGSGNQTRSFCYVSDLVDGLMLLARCSRYEVPVNLGNDFEFKIRELVHEVLELVPGEFTFEPLPKDDPTRRRPDLSRARELLGYEPKVQLRQGLQLTVADFRARVS